MSPITQARVASSWRSSARAITTASALPLMLISVRPWLNVTLCRPSAAAVLVSRHHTLTLVRDRPGRRSARTPTPWYEAEELEDVGEVRPDGAAVAAAAEDVAEQVLVELRGAGLRDHVDDQVSPQLADAVEVALERARQRVAEGILDVAARLLGELVQALDLVLDLVVGSLLAAQEALLLLVARVEDGTPDPTEITDLCLDPTEWPLGFLRPLKLCIDLLELLSSALSRSSSQSLCYRAG